MREFRTDLHIHTLLSPCGDLEMSPAQIVSLAVKRGLNIIGITDHNSTLQCELVYKLGGKAGLTVIPGCEITSQEEVHCLGLFENFDALAAFQVFLDAHLIPIPNKPEWFGYQVVVDDDENIVKELSNYLGAALDVSIDTIEQKVHELGGIFIPAHVDRPRNSLFSQLGFIPPDLLMDAMQISKLADEKAFREKYNVQQDLTIVKFSDAHFPDDLGMIYTIFEMEAPSFSEIKKALHRIDGRRTIIPDFRTNADFY